VEEDKTGIEKIGELDIVGLDGERGIDHPAHDQENCGNPSTWPGGDHFHASHESGTGGGGHGPGACPGRAGNGGHHADFFFSPEIFLDISFGPKGAHLLHGLALGSDRVGDGDVDVGAANGLLGGFGPCNERSFPRGFEEHVFRGNDLLSIARGEFALGGSLDFRGFACLDVFDSCRIGHS
jgi:hypothetical protein